MLAPALTGVLSLFLLAAAPAAAQEAAEAPLIAPAATIAGVELSHGREEVSSPLIRIAPEEALVLVEGLTRLAGNYQRVSANAMHDLPVGGSARLAASGHVDWKESKDAPGLDFGMASADLMLRLPLAGTIVGFGPAVQRLWVAGDHFRDAAALQADVAAANPDGSFWTLGAQLIRNRHPEFFQELDAGVALLSGHLKMVDPVSFLDAVDVDFSLVRESNDNDFDDLSNRAVFLRASVDRKFLGINWSLGYMAQRARFDTPFLDGFPARRDRFSAVEFVAEYEIRPKLAVRLEMMSARNRANLALFENDYKQMAVVLSAGW